MKKAIKFIEAVEDNLLMVLLYSMVLVVLVATFGRYTKLFTIIWSDEYARYAMVYLAFIGIAVGTRNRRHYNVMVIVDKLPGVFKQIVQILCTLITLFFYAFITYWAVKLCIKNFQIGQVSPTLKIAMWIPYFAVAFGMGSSVIWTIYNFVRDPFNREIEGQKEEML